MVCSDPRARGAYYSVVLLRRYCTTPYLLWEVVAQVVTQVGKWGIMRGEQEVDAVRCGAVTCVLWRRCRRMLDLIWYGGKLRDIGGFAVIFVRRGDWGLERVGAGSR